MRSEMHRASVRLPECPRTKLKCGFRVKAARSSNLLRTSCAIKILYVEALPRAEEDNVVYGNERIAQKLN